MSSKHSDLNQLVTAVTGDGGRDDGGIERGVETLHGARNQAEKVLVAPAIFGLLCPIDHPGVRSDRVARGRFLLLGR